MSRLPSPRSRARSAAPRRRLSLVAGAVLGTVLALAAAAPASASSGDDGEVLGDTLSVGRAALIYVGIPLAIIAVIWLLASIPSMVSTPRYRPGLSWWAAPVWFNGPAGGPAPAGPTAPVAGTSPATRDGGGSSARW